MGLNTVQEIERAIGALTPQELEELRVWLDQYNNHPQPIDTRVQSDLAAGRLDKAIRRALDDETVKDAIRKREYHQIREAYLRQPDSAAATDDWSSAEEWKVS
jgi:hypothetical protein